MKKTKVKRPPTPPPGKKLVLNENGDYDEVDEFEYFSWFTENKCEVVSNTIADELFFKPFWHKIEELIMIEQLDSKIGVYSCQSAMQLSLGQMNRLNIMKDQSNFKYNCAEELEEPKPA